MGWGGAVEQHICYHLIMEGTVVQIGAHNTELGHGLNYSMLYKADMEML